MVDDNEVKQFSRAQLESFPCVQVAPQGVTLNDWLGPGGKPIVVDTLESPRFWIQYDRTLGIYRCAERVNIAPFEKVWRSAG